MTKDGRRGEIRSKFLHHYVVRSLIVRHSTLRRQVMAMAVPAYAPETIRHSFLTRRLGVVKRTRKFVLY